MKKVFFSLLLLALSFKVYTQISFVNAYPGRNFTQPVFLTHAGDGTNRVFVVQQNGFIKEFPNDSTGSIVNVFLNVTNKIILGSEQGLLGLAFHPNYSANRYFYVNYTRAGDGATIVSRFTTQAGNPNKADSLSELILLTIPQPFSNHNGGDVMFGQDGFLYIGMGDGGSGGDPNNNAQNVNVLLGKILRIDVNNPSGGNNYGIPAGNPFATGGGAPEIFCIGMRNPWRFSQDPVTGTIYCGDVGQGTWEEIDILQVGKNYGWRVLEGTHCYNPSSNCDTTGKTMPIAEYNHTAGRCSVTGGYVYRGTGVSTLQGRYIYGDYCGRQVYKLLYQNGIVTEQDFVATAPSLLFSFGVDQQNELYALCSDGNIYKMQGTVIGINGDPEVIPEGYSLEQNYPNPFNPSTVIKYSVPVNSFVTLKVFDVTGREVTALVNETKNAGSYSAEWNASAYPSGVYFLRMTSSGNTFEKKMVLIK
ncbi:MAG: PQQ-dependent sugar dehydrogenase [Ignavibacteria bacterium]